MFWYVIQVKTGKEEEFRTISRGIIPADKTVSLYIPTRRMIIHRRGKDLLEDKAVFPGYIFLTTEQLDPGIVGAYRRVPGFLRWLGASGKPEPMGDIDLHVLQQFLGHGELLGISRVFYNENMRIQVLEGPLKGLEGCIVRVDKRKKRARVKLDMYNNSFEVDFSFELIDVTGKDAVNNERLQSPE